jgi:hypothetical protein
MIHQNTTTSTEEGGFVVLVYINVEIVVTIGNGKMGW